MSSSKEFEAKGGATLSRRTLVGAVGVTAATLAAGKAFAQAPPGPVAPPSTITQPPRDFSRNGAPTTYFTDPDILSVDASFDDLRQPNSAIQRLWTGALWSEGPAWNAQGRYLVWSDIPNNRQLRWLEDDGRVTVFRNPSNNSNGNTFDFQGRQLSCEHLMRRVVRLELCARGLCFFRPQLALLVAASASSAAVPLSPPFATATPSKTIVSLEICSGQPVTHPKLARAKSLQAKA